MSEEKSAKATTRKMEIFGSRQIKIKKKKIIYLFTNQCNFSFNRILLLLIFFLEISLLKKNFWLLINSFVYTDEKTKTIRPEGCFEFWVKVIFFSFSVSEQHSLIFFSSFLPKLNDYMIIN